MPERLFRSRTGYRPPGGRCHLVHFVVSRQLSVYDTGPEVSKHGKLAEAHGDAIGGGGRVVPEGWPPPTPRYVSEPSLG